MAINSLLNIRSTMRTHDHGHGDKEFGPNNTTSKTLGSNKLTNNFVYEMHLNQQNNRKLTRNQTVHNVNGFVQAMEPVKPKRARERKTNFPLRNKATDAHK